MRTKSLFGGQPKEFPSDFPLIAAAVMVALLVVPFIGRSARADGNTSAMASNLTLTAAQLQNIQLYKVETSTFHKTIDTAGVVDFDNDQATSVLAPFSGPVSRLIVSLGDHVKKGDPLAVVDSPDFATAISAYRKTVAVAQTNRRLANLDKDLFKHRSISRREMEQAETDAVSAEADRDAAMQSLVSLSVDSKTIEDIREGRPISRIEGTIRSPIAGTVVEKLITPGQLLQPGTTPCFTVADLSRVWVNAQIFDSDISSVGLEDTAEVETGMSSSTFAGIVTNISALVDPNTRSVAVRVTVDNPNEILKKQMYVRVRVRARQESAGLLIPVSAILRDDQNLPFVYVVQSDGSFVRQHVSLGYRTDDRYEIADGLKVDDQIVADGGLFLQFMQTQ